MALLAKFFCVIYAQHPQAERIRRGYPMHIPPQRRQGVDKGTETATETRKREPEAGSRNWKPEAGRLTDRPREKLLSQSCRDKTRSWVCLCETQPAILCREESGGMQGVVAKSRHHSEQFSGHST
eukprot:366232-Chlamydomonas_euryale.AAC.9